MKYKYSIQSGREKLKTNAKKYVGGFLASVGFVGTMAVPVIAAPTPGPEAGPGCFGKWRAGSVQVINGEAPGTDNAGKIAFSVRTGGNSTQNAADRATCAGLLE